MRKQTWARGLVLGVALLLSAAPAQALITRLTPLRDVLDESNFIFTATVESVDADKPALVLTADEHLKGKAPFDTIPVLLKGDVEAKKHNHVPLLLKRVAPKLPVVLFVLKRQRNYTAFVYTNGSWFQITGVEADGKVRWGFTHGEPYLRKTFKGSTAQLREVIADSLAGKKKPPEPDAKEKPGFGPEIEADKPKESKSGAGLSSGTGIPARGRPAGQECPAHTGGPLFAVIPTVLVGGPLAILAMLFPAVFGGLILVLRRWMVVLSVLSLNSTLYLAQSWCMPWLLRSWWGTPLALWLTMTVVTLLGILWAWRRHLALLTTPPAVSPLAKETKDQAAPNLVPGRVELLTLGVLSVVCLAGAAWSLPHSLAQLDLWGKTLLMFSAGLWAATLRACYLRWSAGRRREPRPGLPGEGVMLWTMLLAAVGFSTTFGTELSGPGLSEDGEASSEAGWRYPVRYRVAWRFRPAAERCWMASSPVVDGDRVYVGVVFPSAFKGSGAVCCVDRASGEEVWTFNDEGQMQEVFSSPCVADGRVYIGEGFHQHADCKLYCLDAATGKKLWDFATASHTESTPCVAGGKVYFGAGDDGLYCLDAATGKQQWHLKGLHVDANPLVVGNRLYGGSGVGDAYQETVLFCLDTGSGKEVWRMPVDLPVWSMPAVRGEHLYAGIGNGNFLESADKPAGAVLCLEAATGKRTWRYDVQDGVHVRVSVDARNVYFASRDRHCYCVDRKKGTLRWKTDLGSPVLASPLLLEGGRGSSLYAVSSDGLLSRLDPDTGKIVWTFDVPQDTEQKALVVSSPAVVAREGHKGGSRLIYFGCGLNDLTRGILYCLEEQEKKAS